MSTVADAADAIEAQRAVWRSRILVATHKGGFGQLAVAHLAAGKANPEVAKTAHRWLFERYDMVMGDFNTTTLGMLHNAVTHNHAVATMPSYLPCRDCDYSCKPPAFDQVVVKRPQLQVALSPTQMWRLQRVKTNPRGQMEAIGCPSDHVPVEAIIKHGTQPDAHAPVKVATWNVADPWYFAQYHVGPAVGFKSDGEEVRVNKIEDVVKVLMGRNSIVGLQEVPKTIAEDIKLNAESAIWRWEVLVMRTPSADDLDEADAPSMLLLADPAVWELEVASDARVKGKNIL